MSDAPTKKYDPTESVRTLQPGAFKEQAMTLAEHPDPDKHWIGESLPIPSDAHVKPAGFAPPSAGTSPFPARADHVHGSKLEYSRFVVNTQEVSVNTTTVVSGWVHQALNNSKNWISAPGEITVPYSGMYSFTWRVAIYEKLTTPILWTFLMDFNGGADYILKRDTIQTSASDDYYETYHYCVEIGAGTRVRAVCYYRTGLAAWTLYCEGLFTWLGGC